MITTSDGRKFQRRPVDARVEIRMQSGVLVEGNSRDLSLNGVWFSTDRSLPIGHNTRVRILLESELGKINIVTQGRVVRDDEGGVAIEFTHMGPECENDLRKVMEDEPIAAVS